MKHNQKAHTYVCYTEKVSAHLSVPPRDMDVSGGEPGVHFYDL